MASATFTFYVQPWYRKSPYFEATKRAGCKSWGLYNHMLLPTLYDMRGAMYWRCSLLTTRPIMPFPITGHCERSPYHAQRESIPR